LHVNLPKLAKKLANTYIKKTQTNQCFHPANYLNDSANNTYIKKTLTNQCFHPANYLNDSANNTYIKKTLTNQCFHPANYLNHSANLVKYYLSGFDIFLQKMIVKKLPPSKKRENTVL
jgi:hypothetical protein